MRHIRLSYSDSLSASFPKTHLFRLFVAPLIGTLALSAKLDQLECENDVARLIEPIPLTYAGFKPFGNVIEAGTVKTRSINEGNTTRYHDLAELDLSAEGGKPGLNIFRSNPIPQPMILKTMERHPLSSQAFYPLGSYPYLVVVAPPGELDPSAIVAFLARANQGVNYHKGVWHHYSLALGGISDFLVVDRISDDENCDEVGLIDEDRIEIEMSNMRL